MSNAEYTPPEIVDYICKENPGIDSDELAEKAMGKEAADRKAVSGEIDRAYTESKGMKIKKISASIGLGIAAVLATGMSAGVGVAAGAVAYNVFNARRVVNEKIPEALKSALVVDKITEEIRKKCGGVVDSEADIKTRKRIIKDFGEEQRELYGENTGSVLGRSAIRMAIFGALGAAGGGITGLGTATGMLAGTSAGAYFMPKKTRLALEENQRSMDCRDYPRVVNIIKNRSRHNLLNSLIYVSCKDKNTKLSFPSLKKGQGDEQVFHDFIKINKKMGLSQADLVHMLLNLESGIKAVEKLAIEENYDQLQEQLKLPFATRFLFKAMVKRGDSNDKITEDKFSLLSSEKLSELEGDLRSDDAKSFLLREIKEKGGANEEKDIKFLLKTHSSENEEKLKTDDAKKFLWGKIIKLKDNKPQKYIKFLIKDKDKKTEKLEGEEGDLKKKLEGLKGDKHIADDKVSKFTEKEEERKIYFSEYFSHRNESSGEIAEREKAKQNQKHIEARIRVAEEDLAKVEEKIKTANEEENRPENVDYTDFDDRRVAALFVKNPEFKKGFLKTNPKNAKARHFDDERVIDYFDQNKSLKNKYLGGKIDLIEDKDFDSDKVVAFFNQHNRWKKDCLRRDIDSGMAGVIASLDPKIVAPGSKREKFLNTLKWVTDADSIPGLRQFIKSVPMLDNIQQWSEHIGTAVARLLKWKVKK